MTVVILGSTEELHHSRNHLIIWNILDINMSTIYYWEFAQEIPCMSTLVNVAERLSEYVCIFVQLTYNHALALIKTVRTLIKSSAENGKR